MEARPGLRGRRRRRRLLRGADSRGKWGEVVGEGRVGFHLRPEVLPLEVVAVVLLRLRRALAASFHGRNSQARLPPRPYLCPTGLDTGNSPQPEAAKRRGGEVALGREGGGGGDYGERRRRRKLTLSSRSGFLEILLGSETLKSAIEARYNAERTKIPCYYLLHLDKGCLGLRLCAPASSALSSRHAS